MANLDNKAHDLIRRLVEIENQIRTVHERTDVRLYSLRQSRIGVTKQAKAHCRTAGIPLKDFEDTFLTALKGHKT